MHKALVMMFTILTLNSLTAAPLGIQIIDSSFTTKLSLTEFARHPSDEDQRYSRTNTSPTSASDIMSTNPFTGRVGFLSEAFAQPFVVHAYTPSPYYSQNYYSAVQAEATSEIRFTPTSTLTTDLILNFSAMDRWLDSSRGRISLFDITSDSEVWSRGWFYASDTVLGIPVEEIHTAYFPIHDWLLDLPITTSFDSTHTYKLTMELRTSGGSDPHSPNVTLQLFGLEAIQAIPEPSTLSLFGVAVFIWMRSFKRSISASLFVQKY